MGKSRIEIDKECTKMLCAKKYKISSGVGRTEHQLSSFDAALLDAGVGNYNLVRLSSILPVKCEKHNSIDLEEGSLLPIAYASITSADLGDILCSGVMIGYSDDPEKVGIIMEYSCINRGKIAVYENLHKMMDEAFNARGWILDRIEWQYADAVVEHEGECVTTFACVAEWE